MTGKLRSIPEGKSFGFIEHEGNDYFFHREDYNGDWSKLVKNFRFGGVTILLSFEPRKSNKGFRAGNVTEAN